MIMLKDLLQWMTQGVALTSDILPDNVYPILFITKDPCGKVQIYEYLKDHKKLRLVMNNI